MLRFTRMEKLQLNYEPKSHGAGLCLSEALDGHTNKLDKEV